MQIFVPLSVRQRSTGHNSETNRQRYTLHTYKGINTTENHTLSVTIVPIGGKNGRSKNRDKMQSIYHHKITKTFKNITNEYCT